MMQKPLATLRKTLGQLNQFKKKRRPSDATSRVWQKIGRGLRTLQHASVAQAIQKLDYKARSFYYRSFLYPFVEYDTDIPTAPIHTAPDLWPGNVDRGRDIMKGCFTFQERRVNMGKNLKWAPRGVSTPWLVELHSFEWLADLRATHDPQAKIIARDYLSDWIAVCGQFHTLRWQPYPLSCRLTHWLTHSHWLLEGADIRWRETFMANLVRQANHLPKVLEWHVGGYRLIKNLKAQIFTSLCLPSRQSAYLEAEDLLKKQLEKQILPDGMHAQASPYYHAMVLKDLLDIHAMIIKAGQTPMDAIDETIDRMSVALAFMRHPDGHLALFNSGFSGDVDLLDAIQERCGLGDSIPSELVYAGYSRLDSGPMTLILDAGPVSNKENTHLSHADTLSFELSYGEQRVFVNSGTLGPDHPGALPFRGTPAHNTLTVNHQNSAEVWGQGKLGRRPQKIGFTMGQEPGLGTGVEAHHDGYRHFGIKHTRRIFVTTEGTDLRGEDNVEYKKKNKPSVQVHFHLHPDIKYKLISNAEVELSLPNGGQLTFRAKGGQIFDAESTYCPTGAAPITARKLVVRGTWQKDKCVLNWGVRTKT